MPGRPTRFELEKKVRELEEELLELRNSQAGLRQKEIILDAIFDRSLDAVYLHDFEGRFIDASTYALELLGYCREDIPRLAFPSLLSPDQLPLAMQAVQELLATGHQKQPVEYRIKRKDGGYLWIETRGLLVYRDGRPVMICGIARDITRRKHMEDEFMASSRKYQFLFDSANDGIFIFNGQSFSDCNAKALKMFGCSREQMMALPPYHFYPPLQPDGSDSRIKARACMEAALKGSALFFEWTYLRLDGTTFVAEVNLRRIEIGEDCFLQVIVHDITERRTAEKALMESEQKFRNMAESNAAAIIIHKGDRFIYANPAAERLSGYGINELTRMNFWDIVHPDFLDQIKKRGEARIRGENPPDRYEIKVITKDGTLRWADMSTCIFELGGVPAVMGTAYETTARKQMEEELRRSEEKYRNVVTYASEAIAVVQDNRMIYANPATSKISGYSQEELTLRPFSEFIHPDDLPMVIDRYLRRVAGEDVPTTYSFRFLDKHRQLHWVEMSTALIEWDGKPAVLTFLSDITEAKRAEEERLRLEELLRHSQKMEAIGTLAGGIAHDFNNLLAAIIGFTEIARTRVMESEALSCLDKVLRASERAKDLVSQILSFSRQRAQEFKPIKIAPIVQEAVKLLRASLPATIAISVTVDEADMVVEADPSQIHQVLMNLCANAAHAMRDRGGLLDITLTPVVLGVGSAPVHPDLNPGEYLLMSVKDNGHGMPPEIMERIFEPYFTTKREGEGTGLGLAVIHGIVKRHGGGITVTSEEGRGAEFRVYLPLSRSTAAVTEARATKQSPTGNERILFIDDELDLVEIAAQILKPLGYDVTTRTSSVEALELFRAKSDYFDLVITDLTMPNMTGDTLSMRLLQIRPDIPIILCTGFSRELTKEKALRLGVRDFLLKPIDYGELAIAIRMILDAQAQASTTNGEEVMV
ncbi:MAG: PAS domain S-box protein [Syntrophaceae bacterium]